MKNKFLFAFLITLCALLLTACNFDLPTVPGNGNNQNVNDGKDGKDGKDGVGIESALVDELGHLILYFTDGTVTDCGLVTGANGKDGVSVDSVRIDFRGHLILYFTNGTTVDCGTVKGTDGLNGISGAAGAKGDKGDKGETGVGIENVAFNEDGKLVITLTDGTVLDPIELPKKEDHEHTLGEWTSYGESSEFHFSICTTCKEVIWKFGTCDTHIFTTVTVPPTCIAEGYDENTCSVCDFVEKTNFTQTTDHSYSEQYSYNGSFHWFACVHCEATKDYAEHTIDESGYCTVCNQPLAPSEGVMYDVSADGTYAEVVGFSGTAKRIVIADTYNGLPVRTICANTFQNSNITSVQIPDSITSIGNQAFYSCDNLKTVTIGNSKATVGNNAFEFCHSSLYTSYEYGTYVGDSENPYSILIELTNKNLSTYSIHENTKILAHGVFQNCSRLTGITIPEGVVSMGDYVFYSCSNLTGIILPDGITSIGNRAFYQCYSLASITIPDSVTSIGDWAFYQCYSLASITIPDSVTLIGECAFFGDDNLTNVTFENLDGWWVSQSPVATSGTNLSSNSLQSTSTAAHYLHSTYFSYYWHCEAAEA